MSVFGAGTEKQRELIEQIGSHNNHIDVFSDDMKWMWQESEAEVLSGDKDHQYKLLLFKENKELDAILSKTYNIWSSWGYPQKGDFVKVQYQKDLFGAKILHKLDKDEKEALKTAMLNQNAILGSKSGKGV